MRRTPEHSQGIARRSSRTVETCGTIVKTFDRIGKTCGKIDGNSARISAQERAPTRLQRIGKTFATIVEIFGRITTISVKADTT
jgi:hypothetical protein